LYAPLSRRNCAGEIKKPTSGATRPVHRKGPGVDGSACGFLVSLKKEMEGLAPIDTLRGDRVQVILDRILAQERKLQFSIVEEDLPLSGKTAAKSRPRAKKNAHASPARSFDARKEPGK